MVSTFAVVAVSMVSTGSRLPASALGPFATNVVSMFGNSGDTSIAFMSNGRPVIAHQVLGSNSLELVVCFEQSCSFAQPVTVDDTASVGSGASVALNGSGFAVTSYYDETNGNLKLAICGDVSCTTSTRLTLDGTGGADVGASTSLVIDSSGVPVISYVDTTNGDLKLARCGDSTCQTWDTAIVDDDGEVGARSSLALDSDGHPVISYAGTAPRELKLAVCTDAACTNPTITVLASFDGPDEGVESTSLALNGSLPVVGYSTSAVVAVATCTDTTCSSGAAVVVIGGSPSRDVSLALTDAGFPVVSYWAVDTALEVVVCNDSTCGTPAAPFRTVTTVDGDGAGEFSSMALDGAGNPVITYTAPSDEGRQLRLAFIRGTTATVDVYAGATATNAPQPDQPSDPAAGSPAALEAKLGWPTNMALDGVGNLYFTDRANHTVRMVSAGGTTVTTIAGTPGVPCLDPTAPVGPCGDGGPASSATFRSPWGIAVDGNTPPNIYVSDYGSHKVRRIEAAAQPGDGTVTTFVGTGEAGYDGDGVPGAAAQLRFPSGLALDASEALLIADRGNHRIRRIHTAPQDNVLVNLISTFLGTGTPGPSQPSCSTGGAALCTLDQPTDIEVRGSSTIPSESSTTDFFIADRANDAVLVTRDGSGEGIGIIADRIGSGSAGYAEGDTATAQFDQPVSLAYDALNEQLYIADSRNMRIRRYSAVDLHVITVAGNGTGKLGNGVYTPPDNGGTDSLSTALNFPIGVAFLSTGVASEGRLYASAVYENQIRRFTITPVHGGCELRPGWRC